MRGRPWAVLSDRRAASTQSETVREVLAEVMARAGSSGRVCAAVLVSSASLGLQMRRLGADQGVTQRFFEDERAALAWIDEELARAAPPARR
jgi:hypothetical protein